MNIEFERINQRYSNRNRIMQSTVEQLAGLVQTKKTNAVSMGESSGDTLLDVLMIIGKIHKIQFVKPEIMPQHSNSYSLDEIVEASHVRYRRVKLTGEWYKEDAGPILGFIKDTGGPVALLHLKPGAYYLEDGNFSERKIVDKEAAKTIESYGYIFYRPFENKALNIKDILSYSLDVAWKSDFLKIFIASLLGGVIALVIPFFSGYLFDSLVPDGDLLGIYQLTILVLAIVLSGAMFQIIKAVALTRIEGSMECNLQAAVWDRLLGLPVTFFKAYSAGNLASRVMGISKIRRILSSVVVTTIISSLFSLLNLGLLFYYSTELGMVSLILVLIFMIVSYFIGWKQMAYERQLTVKNTENTGLLYELISGILKFRAAGLEDKGFAMWTAAFKNESLCRIKSAKLSKASGTFASIFKLMSFVVLYYYMIYHFTGEMTTGIFVGFVTAFSTFQLAMLSLVKCILGGSMVIPLYENAKPILVTIPESDVQKSHPGSLNGRIEVRHVDFRYNEDQPLVLKDVSLKIDEGDYIALVGESGSGKSTLFRLLLGFEQPEKGNIYYGHHDLSEVDNRAVRKQLGVVLQDGELMSGTICGNIIGSNPILTVDHAWSAAELAGIADDIREMPMGMNTMISEGISTISGGQKQRILIARAIANKPKILFFDEATSALDNKTQAIVAQSLDGLKTTRIVIAHRLSTIKNCDRIYVMKDGMIVESGAYEELMNLNKDFAQIASRQLA